MKNVYIDGANLKKGLESINKILDYKIFINWLKIKYEIQDVFIFLGYIKELNDFYKKLEEIGYKIIFKQSIKENGIVKANCDVDITLKIILDFFYKKYDSIIFISGDGDFLSVLNFLKSENIKIKILAPNIKTCSIFLKRFTTDIVFLEDKNLNKILFK